MHFFKISFNIIRTKTNQLLNFWKLTRRSWLLIPITRDVQFTTRTLCIEHCVLGRPGEISNRNSIIMHYKSVIQMQKARKHVVNTYILHICNISLSYRLMQKLMYCFRIHWHQIVLPFSEIICKYRFFK